MKSSVRDKIGKEGKSRKHAQENPSDEPLPGKTNQVGVVDAGVGSVPEGRKAVGKRGKRKDEQLPGKRKKRKQDLVSHRAVVKRGKRKDRQLPGKKKKRNQEDFVRNKVSRPTALYCPSVHERTDVGYCPRVVGSTFTGTSPEIIGGIIALGPLTIDGIREEFKRFMELAVEAYKGTDGYKDDCGGQELEEMQMVTATTQMFNGHFKHYYITFTAKGSKDGLLRCYRAHVKCSPDRNAQRFIESIAAVWLCEEMPVARMNE